MGSASFKVPYRPGWACRSAEGQVGCLACGPRVSGSPLSLLNYAVVIRKQPQTGRKQTGVAVSQSSLVSRIRPRPVVCCPLLGNDLGIF